MPSRLGSLCAASSTLRLASSVARSRTWESRCGAETTVSTTVSTAIRDARSPGYHSGEIWPKLLWIVVAMVTARSAAMAFNRLVDSAIDARNPRTKTRHLPAGLLSRGFGWAFVAASSAVFILAAGALNQLCLRLAPLALGLVFFYSF